MTNINLDLDDELLTLSEFPIDENTGRPFCNRCRRPEVVCWCSHLPYPRLNIQTNIIILQHPYEETRKIRTALMLKEGVIEGKCHILIGKRFNIQKHKVLQDALASCQHTYLMFPGPQAIDAVSLVESEILNSGECYNIILLDGTWLQARALLSQNPFLKTIKQVQIQPDEVSEYVIRTQPTKHSLSTLETAAFVISVLDDAPPVYEVTVDTVVVAMNGALLKPLRAMCSSQLNHGSVTHQSKQFLIENGLFCRALPKSRRRRRAMRRNFSVDV